MEASFQSRSLRAVLLFMPQSSVSPHQSVGFAAALKTEPCSAPGWFYLVGMPSQRTPDVLVTFSDLLRTLVDDPESLAFEVIRNPGADTILRVTAPSVEMGRLVGTKGRTARALRMLLQAASLARGERYTLDIVARS